MYLLPGNPFSQAVVWRPTGTAVKSALFKGHAHRATPLVFFSVRLYGNVCALLRVREFPPLRTAAHRTTLYSVQVGCTTVYALR